MDWASEYWELLKQASEREKKDSYPRRMLASAPFAAAQALADVPRGAVDASVDNLVRGGATKRPVLATGVGRGAGRFAAGSVSSPMFLSGIKDLKSEDPDKKRRGYAKVVGSGVAFSASRAGIEAATLSKGSGNLGKNLLNIAGPRTALGLGSAVLTAKSVADSSKKTNSGNEPSALKRYGLPAAVGGLTGLGEGAFEEAWKHRGKTTARGALAAGAGKGAAGVLGGLVLTEAVKRLGPKQTKTAAVAHSAPLPSMDLHQNVSRWSAKAPTADVQQLFQYSQPQLSSAQAAAHHAAWQELHQRGIAQQAPPKAPPPLQPIKGPGVGASLAVLATPLAASAVAELVSSLDPTEQDSLLSEALHREFIEGKFLRQEGEYKAYVDDRVVSMPRRGRDLPAITAHEIAHMRNPLARGKLLQSAITARRRGSTAGTIGSAAILASSMDARFAKPESLEWRARVLQGLGFIAGALQAPLVAEEVRATVSGANLLRRVGDKKYISRTLMQQGPGLATYLAPVALPFAGAALLRRSARKGRESRND